MEPKKKLNLFCQICNFQANRPAEFIRHVDSNKHKRNGVKIKDTTFKCSECDKILVNHFSYKIHKIQMHGTIEEKRKQRYYCEQCDIVFISKLYMESHLAGKKHNNILKSIKLLEEIQMQKILNDKNIKIAQIPDVKQLLNNINNEIVLGSKIINKLSECIQK